MSFCYVVLAHTDPEGLLRLVRRIKALSPSATVMVRYDRRDLVEAETLRLAGALPLVSSLPVRWGDWSLVDAAREALTVATEQTDATWFSVISGQDYPVRDLAAWEREVASGSHDVILDPMPAHPQTWEYRWSSFTLAVPQAPPVERLLNALLDRATPLVRPVADVYRLDRTGPRHWWVRRPRRKGAERPGYLYKASQWMTVSREPVQAALRELAEGSDRVEFLRTVLVPDEIALQSLCAANARHLREAPTTAAHFQPDAPSPDWLTPDLLRSLAATGAPFVRKIPPQADPTLLAAADSLADARRDTPTTDRRRTSGATPRTHAEDSSKGHRVSPPSAAPGRVDSPLPGANPMP